MMFWCYKLAMVVWIYLVRRLIRLIGELNFDYDWTCICLLTLYTLASASCIYTAQLSSGAQLSAHNSQGARQVTNDNNRIIHRIRANSDPGTTRPALVQNHMQTLAISSSESLGTNLRRTLFSSNLSKGLLGGCQKKSIVHDAKSCEASHRTFLHGGFLSTTRIWIDAKNTG